MPRSLRLRPSAHLFTLLAFALAAVFAVTSALAVEQTGDLRGTVRDDQHQPLPGVLAEVNGAGLLGSRSTTTDEGGEFTLLALPPGTYTLRLTPPEREAIERGGIVVEVGRTTTLAIEVRPGAAENVTVRGALPVVETVRTTTSDNFTIEYLGKARVGSAGRSAASVIRDAAGTSTGAGEDPTVRGATYGENVYLLDGVDTTDPSTGRAGTRLPFDAIQEVQIQQGGFAAEFGRASGGIANVVTKSGGNDFSGSFDARYSDEGFSASGDHFDPDQSPQSDRIFEATLGGPIVKDRLWFFTALGRTDDRLRPAGAPVATSLAGETYLAKLTWLATPSSRFILQAAGDPSTTDNVDASPFVAKEATSKQIRASNLITVQYQGVINPDLIVQGQIAYDGSRLNLEPQSGDLRTIGWIYLFTGAQSRNAQDVSRSDRFRREAGASVTWRVPGGIGEHTVKAGADLQGVKQATDERTPGGEIDEVAPDANGLPTPLLYQVTNSAGRQKDTGLLQGYYVQDEWRLHPRLTLNLGVRYDAFSFEDNLGRHVLDSSAVQPRAGVAWDVTGDARNVVRAFAGRYAEPPLLAIPGAVNSRANSFDFYLNETIAGYLFGGGPTPFDINGDGRIDTRVLYGSAGGPGSVLIGRGGHLDATSTTEYSLAYERRLGERSSVSVTLNHRRAHDIIEDFFDSAASAFVVDNIPALEREHSGAEVRFVTAVRGFHLWASYACGRSKGNIDYTQGLSEAWDFHVERVNRYGYLSDDVRHRVRLNGYWDLPSRFEIGYRYVFQTGLPLASISPLGPGLLKYVHPRGYLRGPASQELDLEIRRSFPLGGTILQGILAVTNVQDRENPLTFDEFNGRHPPTSWTLPRRFEVGVRYLF